MPMASALAGWPGPCTQAVKEKGLSISEHPLCASQCAKPETHIVLLKDHNDSARHGLSPLYRWGH